MKRALFVSLALVAMALASSRSAAACDPSIVVTNQAAAVVGVSPAAVVSPFVVTAVPTIALVPLVVEPHVQSFAATSVVTLAAPHVQVLAAPAIVERTASVRVRVVSNSRRLLRRLCSR